MFESTLKSIIIMVCLGASLIADDCSAPWLGAAHSGAPGEVNCSGCHAGSINSGPGSVNYTIGTNSGLYMPGYVYSMIVSVSQENLNQFGFQTVALQESNDSNVGNFILIDEETTRIIEDEHHGTDRIYVGHTVCGADAESIGSNQWEFEWQAPDDNVGNIEIYLSTLAANHNHSTSGDDTYFQIITLTPQTVLLGDLNEDGVINVLDVVLEVNIILGTITPTDLQLQAGDLNGDGELNVLDVVLIVNLILGE
tara:strand:- start:418 stop:1176 length:759 start_codon:yes stop_codon:yes gene_type:complete